MKKNNIEICGCNVVHPQKITQAKKIMPSDKTVFNMADFFKAFSDPTRMKIILALKSGELCVCDLSTVVGLSQSAVSHQLKVLRNHRLVKYRKEGNVVFYTLDDNHVDTLVSQALSHIEHK
ncbi:MAG: metalloregulator ArsR/SmtB family transcription factor [Acholeplasma sp.]|nr:metalloregulator ArsR/SmtB family transcription factor [Acholeplasma sp.]